MTRPRDVFSGFPDPSRERQVMSAWERFLDGGQVPPHTIRGPIESSWSRCLGAGVDPGRAQAPIVLILEELETLRVLHRELIAASLPIMAQAREFLSESGTMLMLTDPGGVVLETEGDPSALEAALDIRLTVGANWTELHCGTNAIGTALSIGKPVQVHAGEHFCMGIKRWTCSATVIRDPGTAEVLGALDVSGLHDTFNHHCLALALTAADRIEAQLATRELERRERLLEAGLGHLSRRAAGGLLFFDRRGRLIKVDSRAQRSLAAMGIELESAAKLRIQVFNAVVSPTDDQAALPEWLLPDWAEPILDGQDRVGTIVVLPDPFGRNEDGPPAEVEAKGGRFEDARRGEDPTSASPFDQIVGTASSLRAVLARVAKVAPTDSTVLLTGETGTGKELVARAVHQRSRRAAHAFVSVNCAAIPQSLITSELFGHEKGAFTGALQRRVGRFELAAGGTIFLDEIGDLPAETQVALLRVLQEHEFERVGGSKPIHVDVRVISATNRDLQAAIAAGCFRSDLFYRLNVFPIELPPLRERTDDIPALAEYFIRRYATRTGKRIRAVSQQTLDVLCSYSWPGNIRELQNVIERSVIVCETEEFSIDESWLSRQGVARPARMTEPMPVAQDAANKRAAQLKEKAAIEAALADTRGRVSGAHGAAAKLGLRPTTLDARIRSLGVDKHQFKI